MKGRNFHGQPKFMHVAKLVVFYAVTSHLHVYLQYGIHDDHYSMLLILAKFDYWSKHENISLNCNYSHNYNYVIINKIVDKTKEYSYYK